jgi:prepilin-type processing-associated H-X9-DG protein
LTLVFLDERADSINDGEWCSSMFGWDPYQPASWYIVDIPASYHAGACGVAFADGHSEIHKWRDVALTIPMGHGPNTPAPNSKNAYWISEHSTRPRRSRAPPAYGLEKAQWNFRSARSWPGGFRELQEVRSNRSAQYGVLWR